MTPREAINLIDQVASNYQGTRQDHAALQNALMVLNALVLAEEERLGGASTRPDQSQEEVPEQPTSSEE